MDGVTARRHLTVPLVVLTVALPGCTASEGSPAAQPTTTPAPATSVEAIPSATASPTASPTATRLPVPGPVSLQALMVKQYDGRGLRVGRVLASTSAYTRHFVTYKSGRLTISGILNVPRGKGPFPVLVLAHGYIDPDIYTNGRGLMREQDYLARRGYVVLHVDYRNHAQSDDDPKADVQLRLGYTEDVINAVLAVKKSPLPYLDKERVGLLGRSLGGGVLYNVLVAQPGLVDAAVAFAPVSSDAADNFDRWIRGDAQRRALAQRIIRAHGSPEENPAFWRDASPRTFFDRVTEPVLIHHGTADDTCPIRWSLTTLAALTDAGAHAQMRTYDGEQHAFGPQWPRSMRATVAFLKANLTA
jgi:dipeptidyl aminopeptidase/acylaminoacyl peptidase